MLILIVAWHFKSCFRKPCVFLQNKVCVRFIKTYESGWAGISPTLALHIFISGVLFLSAMVRIWCLFGRFGILLASVGHANPDSGVAF